MAAVFVRFLGCPMSFIINLNLAHNTKKVLFALLLSSLTPSAWANITMPLPSANTSDSDSASSSANTSVSASTSTSSINIEAKDISSDPSAKVAASDSDTPKETQIKEKAKVYRDPFGNVIASPLKKGDNKSANNDQEHVITEDNIKPTSSLGHKKSSLSADDHKTTSTQSNNQVAKLKVAVVYFSVPEQTENQDVDVLSGASKILTKDQKEQGTVEYLAKLINEHMQGQLFELKNVNDYPRVHQALISQTAKEKDTKARPQISLSPEFNPSDFDLIFIGYPIWWHDLPMPLYSFFNDWDLSGKTIIPFCTHGGNRPYKTFALIAHHEPNAQVVVTNGLVVNRYKVPLKGEAIVQKWLNKINTNVIMPKYSHLQTVLSPASAQSGAPTSSLAPAKASAPASAQAQGQSQP